MTEIILHPVATQLGDIEGMLTQMQYNFQHHMTDIGKRQDDMYKVDDKENKRRWRSWLAEAELGGGRKLHPWSQIAEAGACGNKNTRKIVCPNQGITVTH